MYCNQCGTFMPDHAEFCPNCGCSVKRTQEISVRNEPVRGSKNTVIIGAIVAVAVVLVVSIICFTVVMKSNQDAQLAEVQNTVSEQQNDTGTKTEADTGEQSVTTDRDTEASDAREQEETDQADSDSSTVTNNYYYYGSTAVRDNDYYTRSVSSGYLWPTDTQYISFSDLSGLNQDTVAAIRNEIYARHGYAFTTSRWQTYFAGKTWYHRDSSCTESTINARLSSLERANISTIVSYEESKGWR